MFPQDAWVFIAQGADTVNRKIYTFRYRPVGPFNLAIHFRQPFSVADPMYTISSAGTAFWGGDLNHVNYGYTLQYTRLYLDYVPTSEEQMLNLAWMEQGGTGKAIFFIS